MGKKLLQPKCFQCMPKYMTIHITGTALLGGQGGHLPTQFFRNLRNKNLVSTTVWESPQNSVFLLVKNLGFAHPVFTRFYYP